MATATYELHALIEEARRRARQRRWTYAGVLVLLAGAGLWGGLALTGGSGAIPAPPAPPGYHLMRARGTVQHALVNGSFRGGLNGYPIGKPAREHVELWFNRETGLIRTRGRWSYGRVFDETSRCVPYCAYSGNLFARYWPVDTTKFVRRPGIGTFHGREVIWLGKLNPFAPSWRNGEWIALDPRTHDAVAWRYYGTTDKPEGQVLAESWVVKRFAGVAPNRFWFAVKNKGLDVGFVRFQPVPLDVPGREPARDLRHAAGIVVGRLAGATIFAESRHDGTWRMFSVSRDGIVDGHSRVDDPHTLRAGLVQLGHGSLFTSRAFLVVAGSALAKRGAKLFAVYADGSRQPIRLMLSRKPVGPAAFHFYVIPTVQHGRERRVTGLEVVRGSRVVARHVSMPYQAPEQPSPLALQAALHVLDS